MTLRLCPTALKRICCRCGATFSVSSTGTHTREEECTYHYGRGVEQKGESQQEDVV